MNNICIILLISSLLPNHTLCKANHTIHVTNSITYAETLVSPGGVFELGFFSPESSRNWYVGIWFKNIASKTPVWVANRQTPLRNATSAVLKVIRPGILVLVVDEETVWSSGTSRLANNPIAQLLDSGNLVLREENDARPENYLWQSFDYLSNTFLVGMNFGWNYITGVESYLSSWKSEKDPASGEFTLHLEPSGYPQLITKKGAVVQYRIGPWNGIAFSGSPDVSSDPAFTFTLYMDEDGVYYRGDAIDRSAITMFSLNPNGVGQRSIWVDQTQEWVRYLSLPADNCDSYSFCGAYGSCNIGEFPVCGCLDKFVPKDPSGWAKADWTNGCVRRTGLNCAAGEGFLKYSSIKLPDARDSWYNVTMSLDECKVECLKNCSCMAYTSLDIRGRGSGCLLWFGELVDIRVLSGGGQDLFIRMASSELGTNGKRKEVLIGSLIAVGIALLGVSVFVYIWKKNKNNKTGERVGIQTETENKDFELPLFDLSTISKATNNFSIENKIGEGGYGPVYKGTLEDGQVIAVKRLSKTSDQGVDEFKNEVICIAKLQHRNLVKLPGCCIQGDEKMLLYEYMPNKSLDLILFDEENRTSLDWPKRFNIVNGIARGLMYLHQDSRLRIIHRDLKASNILLDSEMNPKISDFGIAKRFKGNETEDRTGRVVGTYGYMSPEYAMHGRYSIKSDVFSFGVIVLEIVSGKRNRGSFRGDYRGLNLLGHAWTLHKEGRSIELVDTSCPNKLDNLGQVLRLIHVGLLCVQHRPEDRPCMTSAVGMLTGDVALTHPNHPGFFTEIDTALTESNRSSNTASSYNEITITMPHGR
ncbi:hypothetical protein ABFS83_13G174900 [Erythranthe nasuta]